MFSVIRLLELWKFIVVEFHCPGGCPACMLARVQVCRDGGVGEEEERSFIEDLTRHAEMGGGRCEGAGEMLPDPEREARKGRVRSRR